MSIVYVCHPVVESPLKVQRLARSIPVGGIIVISSSSQSYWCNKGIVVCTMFCGMAHIEDLLMLATKNSPGSGSNKSLTCQTPCVETVILPLSL